MVDPMRRPVAARPVAHYTHDLEIFGEVVVCKICGYYSGVETCVKDLRWPCALKRVPRANENFSRLGLGLHPRSGRLMGDVGRKAMLVLGCLAA